MSDMPVDLTTIDPSTDFSVSDPFSVAFDPLQYTGLTDTTIGFTGPSTLQTVEPGSPLVLDTTGGVNDVSSVIDMGLPQATGSTAGLGSVQGDPLDVNNLIFSGSGTSLANLNLSGVSDPPVQSAVASTPFPNAQTPNAIASSALGALSKLGASLSSLFGQSTVTHMPGVTPGGTPANYTPALTNTSELVSGTHVSVLLIIFAVVVILLLRSE